jgi:hypothetical protein
MAINSCSNWEELGSSLPGMFFFASLTAFRLAFHLLYMTSPPFSLEGHSDRVPAGGSLGKIETKRLVSEKNRRNGKAGSPDPLKALCFLPLSGHPWGRLENPEKA